MSNPEPRFITPDGFARIRAEYEELFGSERPKLVEVISWAAGNGDRSENGDYIYGRKRLREIDRRLSYLAKVMNPITAPSGGVIKKIMVSDSQPVEFDQPLVVIG